MTLAIEILTGLVVVFLAVDTWAHWMLRRMIERQKKGKPRSPDGSF